MTHLIDGILLGSLYACAALGLTLVFGVMRLVNLAHGELLVGGAFITYVVSTELGLDPLVSLLITMPVVALITYPTQRLLLTPLLAHGAEPPLVGTFGLSIVAQTALTLHFSADAKSLDASYAYEGIDLLGTRVRISYVIAFVAAIALVSLLYVGLTYLKAGKALRAASLDPEAAASIGIDVKHVYASTFALAAILAAVGGVLIGLIEGFTPTSGLQWLLRAFTVIVLGGMGSIWGTLLGGIALGVAETYAAQVFGPEYRDLVIFLLLVAVLVIRPQGLLGRRLA